MPESWSIARADLRCRVRWDGANLLWQLEHPMAPGGATEWTPIGELRVDCRPVRWTRLVDATTAPGQGGAPQLDVVLEDETGRLRLARSFQLFDRHPFARTWATVENTGTGPGDDPIITDAAILQLAFPGLVDGQPVTLMHVEQFCWRYHKDFFNQHQIPFVEGLTPAELRMGSFPSHYGGTSSCAWAAVRVGPADVHDPAPRSGDGLVVGIEFNGKSRLRAWMTGNVAYLDNRMDDLNHVLKVGAPFEVAPCFLGFFHGDWDEAGYATQRFAEAYVHPPIPDDRYPWVQYNSWKYGKEIDEAQQLTVLERCAELGMEVAVLDLGWARTIGDWHADPAKFPRGLKPIADRAHELGMKFGVHLAIAQCDPQAPVALEHPNWLIHTSDDYYAAGPLCLGHAPCREWLTGEIIRLVGEYNLDYIIQDGEDVVKRCMRGDHTHAVGDSNYACSTDGLDRVIAAVRQAHPHLVWENCEDGGCMMTYRMGRLCHTSITVDNIATYATRQGIYGASYPFSPRYSVRYMQDDPTPYTLRSVIFGGPLIMMQRVTDWDDVQMADTKAAVQTYKKLRKLIRDGKVIHLIPPHTNVESHGRGWDAIQSVSADQGESVVMVFRARGGAEEQQVRLRGLQEDAHYTVRLADAGSESVYSGAGLHTDGVHITLPEDSSEIIELSRIG
jgi:alpha-galactosidase